MPRQGAVLIIPALNEAPVIATTLRRIPAGMFRMVIVADNGSTDGTGEIARRAGAVVARIEERGYGGACLAAIAIVPEDAAVAVFMQADGSEDPQEAEKLLTPIYDGRADLVLGSRVLGRASQGALLPHQRFGNWLATTLVRWLYGHAYSDLGPFRAIRMEALRGLGMRDRNYGWTIEMQVRALRRGLRVMEVPVEYGVRAAGENKVSGNLRASLRAGVKILSVIARLAISAR
ncbi:MAG: glycosyltransferase family 2 protein [Acidobacteria bacterium]|nr:glycosyltransferase family 2 protein [Acidobacteriota bacterium]